MAQKKIKGASREPVAQIEGLKIRQSNGRRTSWKKGNLAGGAPAKKKSRCCGGTVRGRQKKCRGRRGETFETSSEGEEEARARGSW